MPDKETAQDFLSQMHLAVLEECPLHDVAQGSTDLLPDGPVVHGPWPAEHVAAVLRTWYTAGWIDLYLPELPSAWKVSPAECQRRLRTNRTLDPADATDLLDQPQRWTTDRADGQISLCLNDLGATIDLQLWLDLADGITPGPDQT